jgi:hypothetical protein
MAQVKRYPAEFVARVKAEYPKRPTLHKLLDDGESLVGRYLDDSSTGGLNAALVIQMIDENKVAELRSSAQALVRRKELYAEWSALASKMFYGR